jgi:catechol 2,3-dioxygenase
MTEPRVAALRSAELGITDVGAAGRFFTGVWGLEQTAEAAGVRFLRGTGPNHHIVVLHERPTAELVRVNLLAETGKLSMRCTRRSGATA